MRWAIAIGVLRGMRRLVPEPVRPALRHAIEEMRVAAVHHEARRRALPTFRAARGVKLNVASGPRNRR